MPTVGSSVRLQVEIRDADNALANPTDLTLTYRSPSGTETAVAKAAMSNPSLGVWRYNTPALTEAGTWAYRFVATTPTVTVEDTFDVDPSAVAGAADARGPCQPWCTPEDLERGGWTAPSASTTGDLLLACRAASEACWELGGRRWPGLCWDSIIPQLVDASGGTLVVLPDGRGGATSLLADPSAGRFSHHRHGPTTNGLLLDLGQANVTAIDQIRVDGTALASSAYRLIDRRFVARIDGNEWPTWNPPDQATLDLEVDFTYGDAPIALGVIAAIELARELVKGLAGGDCDIDPRVTALVREGISLDLASVGADGEFVETKAVRRFINAVNPARLQRAASVIIPGVTTWPSRT